MSVEPFYDQLMPALGLTNKRYCNVDEDGEWTDGELATHNTVEYYEPAGRGATPFFIGFVEDRGVTATRTRIAFRIQSLADAQRWIAFLKAAGARNIELSDDMATYPAIFFEDPCDTKLELCARKPKA